VHERHRLRRRPARREHLLLVAEGIAEDHRRGREVAEHELVALLGDGRGGGDVDHQGDALLLGHLGDRRRLPGVEGADEQLCALADQPLGAGTRHIRTGFGVAVHDGEVRQPEVLEDAGGDLDAALAVLSDARLHARARQQHADLEARALRAADGEGARAREQAGGADARGKRAPGYSGSASSVLALRFFGHCCPPCGGSRPALTAANSAGRRDERRLRGPAKVFDFARRLAIIVA
jgi:hypothetical protein